MTSRVLLDHGSGGKASQRLIADLFLKYFGNPVLDQLDDAACISMPGEVAVSTDTFTVDPLFFPGGDIGSLAIHGTVNDVAMLGAKPRYLTVACILEEGLSLECLEQIVLSMSRSAEKAGVKIVTGDTKVVPKGAVDKIFINTTGLGIIGKRPFPQGHRAKEGDAVLINGPVGDHGLTVLTCREGLSFETPVKSDSAPLNGLLFQLIEDIPDIHVLRDPTRGGLATTLNEIADQSQKSCLINEDALAISPEVREGCSLLGLDPLYLANEGKFVSILPEEWAHKALEIMRNHEFGRQAKLIGRIGVDNPGRVTLKTAIGGYRILNMLEGEQLPRIC